MESKEKKIQMPGTEMTKKKMPEASMKIKVIESEMSKKMTAPGGNKEKMPSAVMTKKLISPKSVMPIPGSGMNGKKTPANGNLQTKDLMMTTSMQGNGQKAAINTPT